jgi:predicted NBD/HSP70 family sugar kinase
MDKIVLGVDIGGSHITSSLVNTTTGTLVKDTLVRKPVDSEGGEEQIIGAWLSCIQQTLAAKQSNVECMGIAMPGPFDYENGISLIKEQKKYRSLFGVNIKQQLSAGLALKEENIFFMNDACSFLQGEVSAGAAKNKKHAIGITLGTGLGSARIYNGKIEDADLWSLPFKAGIAEDFLSTRWFKKEYLSRFKKEVQGVKELVDLVEANESVKEILELFGTNLGLFLSVMYNKYNCPFVVIGGNISKAAHLFLDSANAQLKQEGIAIEIKPGILGEAAAMIGAACHFQS